MGITQKLLKTFTGDYTKRFLLHILKVVTQSIEG